DEGRGVPGGRRGGRQVEARPAVQRTAHHVLLWLHRAAQAAPRRRVTARVLRARVPRPPAILGLAANEVRSPAGRPALNRVQTHRMRVWAQRARVVRVCGDICGDRAIEKSIIENQVLPHAASAVTYATPRIAGVDEARRLRYREHRTIVS